MSECHHWIKSGPFRKPRHQGKETMIRLTSAVLFATASLCAQPLVAQSDSGGTLIVRTGGNGLNVRSGPGTGFAIVTSLPNGTEVRNLGCEGSDRSQWCRISTLSGPDYEGWVSGRFMVEGSGTTATAPAEPAETKPEPEEAATTPAEPAAAEPAAPAEPATEQVQTASPGGESAGFTGTLDPGATQTYIVKAAAGQNLTVTLRGVGSDLYYQILNPDQSVLSRRASSSVPFIGNTVQSGDHVLEVTNLGGRKIEFRVDFAVN
jgi:uncharacterized protein YraI